MPGKFVIKRDWYRRRYLSRLGGWPKSAEKALADSIAKWAFLVDHPGIDEGGTTTCALCHLFLHPMPVGGCVLCPVKEETGEGGCRSTPWRQDPNKTTARGMLALLLRIQHKRYPRRTAKR